jgi:death-on-curing protein
VEPNFLTLDEIVEIHRDQIARYGGSEGIRDFGMLQSAAAVPTAGVAGQFLHTDLCEMAAAYLFHIVGNHPFIDGNKRLTADQATYVELVLSVARGETPKSAVAEFF